MKNLLKAAGLLAVGFIAGHYSVQSLIKGGEVIHEDEDKYIRVEENKKPGWSYAEVVWKHPIEK